MILYHVSLIGLYQLFNNDSPLKFHLPDSRRRMFPMFNRNGGVHRGMKQSHLSKIRAADRVTLDFYHIWVEIPKFVLTKVYLSPSWLALNDNFCFAVCCFFPILSQVHFAYTHFDLYCKCKSHANLRRSLL